MTTKKVFNLFFVLILIFMSSSCSRTITHQDIPGVYVNNEKNYSDTIEVFANNRYLHYYTDHNGSRLEQNGKWETNKSMDVIYFGGFAFFGSAGGAVEWGSDFEWDSNGNLCLNINRDSNNYYQKQN